MAKLVIKKVTSFLPRMCPRIIWRSWGRFGPWCRPTTSMVFLPSTRPKALALMESSPSSMHHGSIHLHKTGITHVWSIWGCKTPLKLKKHYSKSFDSFDLWASDGHNDLNLLWRNEAWKLACDSAFPLACRLTMVKLPHPTHMRLVYTRVLMRCSMKKPMA